jgi:hypothetical protein
VDLNCAHDVGLLLSKQRGRQGTNNEDG